MSIGGEERLLRGEQHNTGETKLSLEDIIKQLKMNCVKNNVRIPPPSLLKFREALFNVKNNGFGEFQFFSSRSGQALDKKIALLKEYSEKAGFYPLPIITKKGSSTTVAFKLYSTAEKRDSIIRDFFMTHSGQFNNIQAELTSSYSKLRILRNKRGGYLDEITKLKKARASPKKIKQLELKVKQLSTEISSIKAEIRSLKKARDKYLDIGGQLLLHYDHFYQSLAASEVSYYSKTDPAKFKVAARKFAELAFGAMDAYKRIKTKIFDVNEGRALIYSVQFSLLKYIFSHGMDSQWEVIAKYKKGEINARSLADAFVGSNEDNLFLSCISTSFLIGMVGNLSGDFKTKYYGGFRYNLKANNLTMADEGHSVVALISKKDPKKITLADGTTLLPGQNGLSYIINLFYAHRNLIDDPKEKIWREVEESGSFGELSPDDVEAAYDANGLFKANHFNISVFLTSMYGNPSFSYRYMDNLVKSEFALYHKFHRGYIIDVENPTNLTGYAAYQIRMKVMDADNIKAETSIFKLPNNKIITKGHSNYRKGYYVLFSGGDMPQLYGNLNRILKKKTVKLAYFEGE